MKMYNAGTSERGNIESNSFLQVNSCGIQSPCTQDLISFRKNGRVDYHIVYVVDGTCEIEYDKKIEIVKRGGFVLYPPNTPQKYTEYSGTKKLWLHFNGFSVSEILQEARLSYGIHHAPPSSAVENSIIQLVTEHNRQPLISNEKAILMTLLYDLGKLTNGSDNTGDKISDCISFIVSHYNSNVSLDEMASSCHLSKSRFIYLFKQQTGFSPHAFMLSLRIDNSKHLLAATNLDIAQISRIAGYEDALYFSRLFKKHTGLSPLQYRNLSRQNNNMPD